MPEPWLRGTLTEVSPVIRAVLHALELAEEDVVRWCEQLTDAEVNARRSGLAAFAFQVRHIAGSLDRLLTYAEGSHLSEEQMRVLRSLEHEPVSSREELLSLFAEAIRNSKQRVRNLEARDLGEPRYVGQQRIPTTLGGLLVHVADHTQRHVGEAIVTAKVLLNGRGTDST